jgi:branched-chain amino acid transport system ATP-binding protein
MLKTTSITKHYGALCVTDHVSLDIRKGELHAIIGPNGAGKTTLINQLSGELKPDSGDIYFNNHHITALSISARARLGLVRSYQITSVFDDFTVYENAVLAALGAKKHAFRFWENLLSDKTSTAAAHESIAACGLLSHANLKASRLGHGERRQLELAMTLATKPEFLLLDEPLAGMSAQESLTVIDLLQSLKKKYTILLIEHDMNAVFTLADRISVLVYGKVLTTGTPIEIRDNEAVRNVYLGDEEIAV